jgi:hypothetical protein
MDRSRKVRQRVHRTTLKQQSHREFYRINEEKRDCATNSRPCEGYESHRCDITSLCPYAQQQKILELRAREASDNSAYTRSISGLPPLL